MFKHMHFQYQLLIWNSLGFTANFRKILKNVNFLSMPQKQAGWKQVSKNIPDDIVNSKNEVLI